MNYVYSCLTGFAPLTIKANENAITGVSFSRSASCGEGFIHRENDIIRWALKEIQEYFRGERRVFSVPVFIQGTGFQMRVWRALRMVNYGETVSYAGIARLAGSAKACRAAGGALNKNPIAIILPCHRVIAHDGSPGGFAGGPELKRKLLRLEGHHLF